MLQNAYLLAKIGSDTAENERNFAKNWQLPYGSWGPVVPRRPGRRGLPRRAARPRRPRAALPPRAGAPRSGRAVRCSPVRGLGLAKLAKIAKLSIFCKILRMFWWARSRLYQNEILQENMRLTAFFKLCKICTLLHRCNLKCLRKNRLEKSAILWKFSKMFANVAKICFCAEECIV